MLKGGKVINAEIHSINTSKGDTADVGIFSDNTKVTVYEFLEAAEIANLGWGNSVQKANRLYNRQLSEEIKAKLINKSDSYAEMKLWWIQNYGAFQELSLISLVIYPQEPSLASPTAMQSLLSTLTSPVLFRG